MKLMRRLFLKLNWAKILTVIFKRNEILCSKRCISHDVSNTSDKGVWTMLIYSTRNLRADHCAEVYVQKKQTWRGYNVYLNCIFEFQRIIHKLNKLCQKFYKFCKLLFIRSSLKIIESIYLIFREDQRHPSPFHSFWI